MASATATGLSIGIHVLASGMETRVALGKLGRESSRGCHREELARLAPDQQDGLIKPRNRLGGIDQQLWPEAGQGRDETVGHPWIASCWREERFFALVVQSARGDGGDELAPADRRSKL